MTAIPVFLERGSTLVFFAVAALLVATLTALSADAARRAGLGRSGLVRAPATVAVFLACWFGLALVTKDSLPLLAQENIEDILQMPEKWAAPGAFLLRVKGDSMVGAHILDGDYVLVHPQPTAAEGEIVVALIGEEATVKRFHKTEHGITLKAENPKFSPIVISSKNSESFRIAGRVAGVMRLVGNSGKGEKSKRSLK